MTTEKLWGGETDKAVANFPVSGEPIPAAVAHWLGRIKAAAARANADLELLDAEMAGRIAAAADRVAAGEVDDQFPIDVFQTGSGAELEHERERGDREPRRRRRARERSRQHGPVLQRRLPLGRPPCAALAELAHDLLPALERLAASLERKAFEFDDVVKSGRTHLDGRGARHPRPGVRGLRRAGAPGDRPRRGRPCRASARSRSAGPPTGTGSRHPTPSSPPACASASPATPASPISAPVDHFEAQAARDGLVEASGALKVVAVSLTKIANDRRCPTGSGPRAGLAELFLPELQKGSSIMPGKVNPVIPEVVTQVAAQVIGNDTAITIGGMGGQLRAQRLHPADRARNLLRLHQAPARAPPACFAEKCVDGLEAKPRPERALRRADALARPPPSTPSSATTGPRRS